MVRVAETGPAGAAYRGAGPDDRAGDGEAAMAIGGRRRGLAAGLGLAVALWGAGQVAGPVLAAGAGVTIANFAYTPASVTIAAGESVLWTMGSDPEQHTVTPDVAGAFTGSGILGSGQTFQVTFETPGTYPYHCQLHPFMKGTVVVTGGSGTPTPTAASTPTPRPTATPTPTPTPRPSATPTPSPTATPRPSPTPSAATQPTSSPSPASPGSGSPATGPDGSGSSSPPVSPVPSADTSASPSPSAGASSSPAGPSVPDGSSGNPAAGTGQDGDPGGGLLPLLAGLGVVLVAVLLLDRVALARR